MIKIGEKLGHFLIKEEIGRGGMGTIYFAVDTMLNRDVALKAIHPQLADNQQLMDRFKIEAMTQARMNHPNIVTIFSFNKIDDQYIIAMEYIDGKSVKELLQSKKKLAPAEAIDIIIQVAEGLSYAHDQNIIHRDIKPANILLTKDNKVKISDFGIAKVFGAQGLTKTGMMMGTPWYTPPEQIMGKNIDFRADLYSLGITFYELVTSRVPFDSETNSEFQIQKAHLETPPPRPSIYNPQISIKLEKIILQALQKKVEKRYQSAREMITELQKIRSEIGKTKLPPDFSASIQTQLLSVPTVKRRRSLLTPLKVIAFLILLLAGGIFWIIMSGRSSLNESMPGVAENVLPQFSEKLDQAEATLQGLPAPNNADQTSKENIAARETDSPGENAESAEKAASVPIASTEKDQAMDVQIAPGAGKEELPERTQSKDKENSVQEQPAPVERLGSLDAELIRLRGFLARRNLVAADRLADALLQSGAESRIFPLLGNVKFLLNKFADAEQLWLKALQANQLINLELAHMHNVSGDFCLGQLKFKKKIIMFSSDTRGDHSFALQAGNIKAISTGGDLAINITAAINGQELNESFMLVGKFEKRDKVKFLADFLNKYIL